MRSVGRCARGSGCGHSMGTARRSSASAGSSRMPNLGGLLSGRWRRWDALSEATGSSRHCPDLDRERTDD